MVEDAPIILCGFPSPAEDYKEDNLDFNSFLDVRKPSVYALRAKGYSMTGVGIFPEDIIIVDKAKEPTHNALVVASIDGYFTLKRLLLNPEILLHAENPDYEDIKIKSLEELIIFGVVTAVVRKL